MTNKIDMTEGPIFSKLLKFSVPLIFSSVLQLFFNAADIIVVGRFAGDNSLAAVGSTGSLINLLVNLFVGLSVGANVTAAHYLGAGKKDSVKETVQTTILLSIISGIILTVTGVFGSKRILQLMQAPEEVLKLATLYLQIYFGGITSTVIYNFGSALLRAKGDTKRPLIILSIAGVINVCLNLLFVIVFKMDVAGVAIATVISQTFSAVFVIVILLKEDDEFRLELKNIKINAHIFKRIVKIGIPAGFQGIMFSFSNVIIQSSINSFGAIMIAANSAVCNLEGFVYTSMNGFSQGALTFVSQNMGARKTDRIKKIVLISQASIIVIGIVLGAVFLLFGRQLIGIYSKSQEVIDAAMIRCWIIFTTYFLCGTMDAMANSVRGLGHSGLPVAVSLLGVCVFRIAWLSTVFQLPKFHTPSTIFVSYPISWLVTYVTLIICYKIIIKKTESEFSATKLS